MSLKKTSKRGHSTMNELNITPLLDLVFVLLVIFIITTPQLVNNLEINLPSGKKPPADHKPKPPTPHRRQRRRPDHARRRGGDRAAVEGQTPAAQGGQSRTLAWWSRVRTKRIIKSWSTSWTPSVSSTSPRWAWRRSTETGVVLFDWIISAQNAHFEQREQYNASSPSP